MKSMFIWINQLSALHFLRLLIPGLVTLTLTLSSCGSTTDTPDSSSNISSALTANDIIVANALYFNQRTPDGFYKEEFQNDDFYSISHVKNIDLLPLSARSGLAVHELASNDFVEAMGWAEQAATYLQPYKQLVDNSETMLYYQFTRVDPASPQFIHIYRVFKANALDRNGVDRNDTNGEYKGRISTADITGEKVKLILEYLWTFTLSNNYSNAVLESYTIETTDTFVHIMKQAQLTLGYSENCDTIEVYDIRYTIPKASGFIWKDKTLTRAFYTRRIGDRIETCS